MPIRRLIPLFWIFILAACSAPAPSPVSTTPPTPESVSATAAPTPSPEPPAGPWLVVAGPDGFWAYDTASETLSHPETRVPLAPQDSTAMPAPSGGRFAYITGRNGIEDLALNILALPGGEIDSIGLIPSAHMPPADALPGEPAVEAVRALFEQTAIAWSPDGERLAFVGLLESGNADLYVVTLDNLAVTRLTATGRQEIAPAWSPDGEWIVFTAVEHFGTGAGYAMDGAWAVRPDGSDLRLLYETGASGGESFLGWTDPDTLVVHAWTPACGNESLRSVDLATGDTAFLWEGPFNGTALDPATGALLVSVDTFTANCEGAAAQGLYLLPGDGGAAVRLTDEEAFLPNWSPEAGLFFARTPGQVLAVDPRGGAFVIDAPAPVLPSASARGELAWALADGIWVGGLNGEAVQVFEGPAGLPAWGPGGLYFFGEAGLYFLGEVVELVGEGASGSVAFWVGP